MWNYFDKVYCINLEHRKDRWLECQQEFERAGLEVERFNAFSGDNRVLAFNKSQYGSLKKALADGCDTFLVLEDDVVFKSYNHLPQAISELPRDWDLFYLGANLVGSDVMRFQRPVRTGQYVSRLYDCWQSHAIAYTRKAAQWIVDHFDDTVVTAENPIYDEWLRVRVHKSMKSFIVNPQIAVQRPGFSDLWQNQADYTGCFYQGNNLMAVRLS